MITSYTAPPLISNSPNQIFPCLAVVAGNAAKEVAAAGASLQKRVN